MKQVEYRTYKINECVVFWKTREEFGGLSNMAGGYPVLINNVKISTIEAFYQACKFPDYPEIQKSIIGQSSPIFAKKVAKPHEDKVRKDWMDIRVNVMRWCLRIKLIQNWNKFSSLLISTNNKSIVEFSEKDDFWGALEFSPGELHGRNVLGRLLMELRTKIIESPEKKDWQISYNELPKNLFLGNQISSIPLTHNFQRDLFDFEIE